MVRGIEDRPQHTLGGRCEQRALLGPLGVRVGTAGALDEERPADEAAVPGLIEEPGAAPRQDLCGSGRDEWGEHDRVVTEPLADPGAELQPDQLRCLRLERPRMHDRQPSQRVREPESELDADDPVPLATMAVAGHAPGGWNSPDQPDQGLNPIRVPTPSVHSTPHVHEFVNITIIVNTTR